MIHYGFENTNTADITTAFPHSPTDVNQSILDYLEDKLANGLDVVSLSVNDGGRYVFVFRVVGK